MADIGRYGIMSPERNDHVDKKTEMHKKTGYSLLMVKAAVTVAAGLIAIFRPELLETFFTYPVIAVVKIYHIFWLLTFSLIAKRMFPGLNRKVSSGKIFKRFHLETVRETPSRNDRYLMQKKKVDSGALRSALYWALLILVMGMWRKAGMLSDTWIFIIVLFFIFMDQFCVNIFCPFQWLMGNKCCNTCRIDNWGYLMAFSPLIFICSFWTYSIVALASVSVIQWEYLYWRHPERFFEMHNASLTCSKCQSRCTRKGKLH